MERLFVQTQFLTTITEVKDVSATDPADPATIKLTAARERSSQAANITRTTLAIKLSSVCNDGLIRSLQHESALNVQADAGRN
jgi:hypothetical protein